MNIEAGGREMIRTALASVLALVAPAHLAAAEIITVCADGCDFTSIQDAIDAASDNDVIDVGSGIYAITTPLTNSGKSLTIQGSGDPKSAPPIIDGQFQAPCFTTSGVDETQIRLIRLHFTNGWASNTFGGDGGGISHESGSLELRQCVMSDCHAADRGGAVNIRAQATLVDCIVRGCSADSGGGIFVGDVGGENDVTITGTWIHENNGTSGGGIFSFCPRLSLSTCDFWKNNAVQGAALNCYDDITAADCTFRTNYGIAATHWNASGSYTRCVFSGNDGGGLVLTYYSSPYLYQCDFIENTAGEGGAIRSMQQCSPYAEECRFIRNRSANESSGGSYGGALSLRGTGGAPLFENCQFAGNLADTSGSHAIVYNQGTRFRSCTFAECCDDIGDPSKSVDLWTNTYGFSLEACVFLDCCKPDSADAWSDLGGNSISSSCNECIANIDCRNDAVDAGDLGYLLARWGTDDLASDVDGDGQVRAADLGLLIAAWGPCQ